MVEKEYPTLRVRDIKPYENNPRINDDAAEDVAESIRQCGYIANIIVDENNVILAGHTRFKALKKAGQKEIEVIRVSGLTDEQKKKYRLLDNKTNERALWDFELLDNELLELDFEGYDFGFNEPFTIDDIQEVDSYDENNNDNEFFTAAFTFPTERKKAILSYLRKHKKEITEDIIRKSQTE